MKIETYKQKVTLDNGQVIVNVHPPQDCEGRGCPIHHPSEHSMINFPLHWRNSYLMERVCEHGIGHPDPDHIAFVRNRFGNRMANLQMEHNCDGCCSEHSEE